MDNLESVSDKLKIERLSELVKSLYENIDDLKSQLDEKNIAQSNKAFNELYEKHQKLESELYYANEGVEYWKMKNSNSHADILQKGYDGLKKELAELNHLQLTMRTMYENLYDDYRDVKVELAQWKEYASELMSARHYLHKKNGKLEKEKAILENNAAKHKKEIETLASTISGMENELNKKDFEIDELSNTIQFASYILKNGGDIPRD